MPNCRTTTITVERDGRLVRVPLRRGGGVFARLGTTEVRIRDRRDVLALEARGWDGEAFVRDPHGVDHAVRVDSRTAWGHLPRDRATFRIRQIEGGAGVEQVGGARQLSEDLFGTPSRPLGRAAHAAASAGGGRSVMLLSGALRGVGGLEELGLSPEGAARLLEEMASHPSTEVMSAAAADRWLGLGELLRYVTPEHRVEVLRGMVELLPGGLTEKEAWEWASDPAKLEWIVREGPWYLVEVACRSAALRGVTTEEMGRIMIRRGIVGACLHQADEQAYHAAESVPSVASRVGEALRDVCDGTLERIRSGEADEDEIRALPRRLKGALRLGPLDGAEELLREAIALHRNYLTSRGSEGVSFLGGSELGRIASELAVRDPAAGVAVMGELRAESGEGMWGSAASSAAVEIAWALATVDDHAAFRAALDVLGDVDVSGRRSRAVVGVGAGATDERVSRWYSGMTSGAFGRHEPGRAAGMPSEHLAAALTCGVRSVALAATRDLMLYAGEIDHMGAEVVEAAMRTGAWDHVAGAVGAIGVDDPQGALDLLRGAAGKGWGRWSAVAAEDPEAWGREESTRHCDALGRAALDMSGVLRIPGAEEVLVEFVRSTRTDDYAYDLRTTLLNDSKRAARRRVAVALLAERPELLAELTDDEESYAALATGVVTAVVDSMLQGGGCPAGAADDACGHTSRVDRRLCAMNSKRSDAGRRLLESIPDEVHRMASTVLGSTEADEAERGDAAAVIAVRDSSRAVATLEGIMRESGGEAVQPAMLAAMPHLDDGQRDRLLRTHRRSVIDPELALETLEHGGRVPDDLPDKVARILGAVRGDSEAREEVGRATDRSQVLAAYERFPADMRMLDLLDGVEVKLGEHRYTLRVIRTSAELRRNREEMVNCTLGLEGRLMRGDILVAALNGEGRAVYNAHIMRREGGGWDLGEVNKAHNRPDAGARQLDGFLRERLSGGIS